MSLPEPCPMPLDGPVSEPLFCATSAPGCRQMVLILNAHRARAVGKVIVAGQLWTHGPAGWQCDRCSTPRRETGWFL